MNNKENSKPWQNWALLGWMVLVPSGVLSLVLIGLADYPWCYAIPTAIALSLMAWAGILKALFS